MSNLVLPSFQQLRKLGWGWPVKKTPSFSTIVQTPASRRGEVRISLTPQPVWNFEVNLAYIYGDLNQSPSTGIQTLLDFYTRVQGAAEDWLYQDPYDNISTGDLLGYGNAINTQFQIGRTIDTLGFEPMQNVFPAALKINGVTVPAGPQASGNQWYCGLENLLNYSQDLSQSVFWTPNQCTIAAPAIVAPDGSSTANALTGTSTDGYAYQTLFASSLAPCTFSVWLKVPSATLSTFIRLRAGALSGFDIQSQPVALTTSWQRFSVTATIPSFFSQVTPILLGGSTVGTGQVVHIWGAQLERWNAPTSYVATTNNAPVIPRGMASFTIAPANGTTVTSNFGYYYRCRFLDDEWNDLEEFMFQLWEMKSLKFRSVLL